MDEREEREPEGRVSKRGAEVERQNNRASREVAEARDREAKRPIVARSHAGRAGPPNATAAQTRTKRRAGSVTRASASATRETGSERR